MPKTARDLFNEALSFISVLEAGQVASAEDFEKVRDLFPTILNELNEREDCYLALEQAIETTEIPDGLFLPLMEYTARVVAPHFGKPAMTEEERILAQNRIRRSRYIGPVYDAVTGCFF